MYSSQGKLALAVKSQGKILREHDGKVMLPFQSEFSLVLKNLHSVAASVTITIDGEDIAGGRSFVVDPASSIDIERYVNDLSIGNRFKFIARSEAIEQHRGTRIDDGLICATWRFAKRVPRYDSWWINQPPYRPYTKIDPGYAKPPEIWCDTTHTYGDAAGPTPLKPHKGIMRGLGISNSTVSTNHATIPGITVPGSESTQAFEVGQSFPLEDESHTLVIQLIGQAETVKVTKPLTVNTRVQCSSCGLRYKSSVLYCSKCGTALQVI